MMHDIVSRKFDEIVKIGETTDTILLIRKLNLTSLCKGSQQSSHKEKGQSSADVKTE